MRKLLLLLSLLVLGTLCGAQAPVFSRTSTFTAVAAGDAIATIGGRALYYRLFWYPVGSPAACTVEVDSSLTGTGSWGSADVVAAQTCTSPGSTLVSTAASYNYVRMNVTALSANKSVVVTLAAYESLPANTPSAFTNACVFSGASVQAKIDAAITSCGSSSCVVVLCPTLGAGSPTTIPSNVVVLDLRQGTPLSGDLGNSTSVNVADAGVVYEFLDQARNASPTKSTIAHQSMNQVTGSLPASQTQGAILGQVYTAGALTSVGASSVIAGAETVTSIKSTGQTVPDARGLTANVTTSGGAGGTNVTQAASVYAQAISKAGTGTIANAFSLIAEGNSAGSTRNFAAWYQGDILTNNQASGILAGVCNANCNGHSIYSQNAAGAQFPWVTFGGATAGTDVILQRPLSDTKGFTWTAQNATTFWARLLGGSLSVGNWSVDPTAGAFVAGSDAATTSLGSNLAGFRSNDSAQGQDWRVGNNVTGAVAKTDFCITNASGFAVCGMRATSTHVFNFLSLGTDPKGDVSGICADSAGAAACGSAAAGSFVIDAGTTATVVSTTAVTANSQIFLQEDSSLSTRLGVTCNTQSSLTLGALRVTARTAATSFTATLEVGPTTNPMCVSYFIIN